jgi:adenosylhomocysteinase
MSEAAAQADILVTVTGNTSVIREEHFARLKDGAILANSGHFNVEIDLEALERGSASRRTVRPLVDEFTQKDGRHVYVLGEGRLINLAAAEGHPAAVMDMSFANQALSVEHLVRESGRLERKVYRVPVQIDRDIARLKLASMGVRIDELTSRQQEYLASWTHGT